MQKILEGGTERIELAPGSILFVKAIGAGSVAYISLISSDAPVAFTQADTTANGNASAGPFAEVVTVAVFVTGRSAVSVVPMGSQSAVSGAGNRPQSVVLKRLSDQVGVTVSGPGAVTATIDAASPFGRPALKLSGFNAGNVEVSLSGLNLAKFDDHIVIPTWISDHTLIPTVTLYAGTTGYGRNYAQIYQIGGSDQNRWSGEHAFAVGPLRSSAEATFVTGTDTLNEAKIRLVAPNAALVVWIDCFKLVPKTQGVVIWTFDDGFASWKGIQALLERYGMRGSFGIQSSTIGTNPALWLNPPDVLSLALGGHDVAPHQVANTRYNDGTGGTQTAAQYQADFRASKNAIMGWTEGRATAAYTPYVQGGNDRALHDALRAEGLRIARGTDALGHNFHAAGLGRSVLALKTRYLEGVDSRLDDYKADIDACGKYGSALVFMGHDFAVNAGVAPSIWKMELMERLVAYAATKLGPNLVNMTMTQYQALIAQLRLAENTILADWTA